MSKLTYEQSAALIAEYRNGSSLKELCDRYGLWPTSVITRLKTAKVYDPKKLVPRTEMPVSKKVVGTPPIPPLGEREARPAPMKPPIAAPVAPAGPVEGDKAPTASCIDCGAIYPQVWYKQGKRWLRPPCHACTSADATPVTRPLPLRSTPFNPEK